ncbi:hypothetical protein LOD99_12761 [Oopsacas minuta]|uniref:Uncharacterized protein n=1 Tax=Oopsacas minuta TaxID=111878 RepID=A0AAV7JDU5_9METZ|nr:hypothetical protein LOD99_12761 [Oopsacas minuta]
MQSVQLEVCTQEILRLTAIIDSYEKEVSEHYQDQVNTLNRTIREIKVQKKLVENEKAELILRLEELDEFIPPQEITGLGEDKNMLAAKYLGRNYMQLLDNLVSLEIELIEAKKREESTRSKFTEHLEGKEIMLLEMIDKESSLKEEITDLEKEGKTLSERYETLTQECGHVAQEKELFKQRLQTRDVELDDLKGKAIEGEEERNKLSSEIESLNDWKRKESLAQDHARRLQEKASSLFIRSDSKHRRESSARIIQQYWSMHRTKKRQNSFVNDYNWAVGMVQEGFDKYQTDIELINKSATQTFSADDSIEAIVKSDASSQTEELVLINLLQELKEREELSWAVDTIQQGFEKFSRDNKLIQDQEGVEGQEGEFLGIRRYLTVGQAMKIYKQNEPED